MQNVPKIVSERLKATTSGPSTNHPDADILTAFAEHSLPVRECDVVLEHLSRCGDCREIVALALPAVEAVETVVPPHAHGWLTWPALRWGLAVAGVIAITSLGIVQYQRSTTPRNMAEKSAASVEVAANHEKQQPLETPVPAAPAMQSDKIQPSRNTASGAAAAPLDGEKKSESRVPLPQRELSQTLVTNGTSLPTTEQLPHGPKLANQWQQQANAQNQVPASTPAAKQQVPGNQTAQMQIPPSSETVEVESAAAPPESPNKNLEAGKVQDLPSVRQPATEEYALARIGKAKPAVTMPVNDGSASAMPGPVASGIAGATATSLAHLPTWSISSSGTLQRSYDQGASWQVVDVNANLGAFDAVSVQSTAKSSRADSKDAQALKRDSASPTFRTVAASGADVWAGGSHGTLYHSLDAGDHWTRVLPSSTGAALTGDILSLDFVDPQHGRVSTSTAENWITTDGGQNWQKQ